MSKRKMTKIRYRFPKFHLDWKEDEFKGIFDFHQTNTFSRSQMNNRREFTRNIHYGDILTKYGNILSDLQEVPYINKDISLLKFKEESYLQNGDIIIADTAEDLTVGKAIEVQNIDGKVLSGLHTILCRPKFKFAPRFLGYYINSSSYRSGLIPLVAGVKVCSISKTNISKTLIMYPDDINEQQKIANCLSSIDDLISAEEKKLSLLSDYKEGWMQKLFPAEGKTIPDWRFPGFKDSEEWEKIPLGQISLITTGKLDANAMVEDGKYRFYTCAKEFFKIDKYAFDTEALLISGNGANVGYIHYYKGKFNAYQRTYVLHEFKKNICYVKYFLEKHLSRRIANEKNSGNTPYILRGTLSEMEIIIPEERAEQEKIADFLSGIDELISGQKEKIEKLKQHKKALMQGLFPIVEEVL